MIPVTVLLADDEDTLRENLAEVLREECFEVISCRDGAQALRALRQQSIDAIVTNLRMPGISGMELIDHARELSPEAPIIGITAFGEVETAVEAMKRGASDDICKPLIQHFVAKYNVELKASCPGFSDAAMTAVCNHTWPGNVRELENVVERALIFADYRPVELGDLPVAISTGYLERSEPPDLRAAMRGCERRFIIETLSRNNNKTKAAAALGIGLSSLYRKLDELQISQQECPGPETLPGA